MLTSVTEKLAAKIVALFDKASLDHADIDQMAWFVKYNASTVVIAKVIYFCERILDER